VELFESTFELRWLQRAELLADGLLQHFQDEAHGGFFFTRHDHEQLIARSRSAHDGATPSGNAVAATWLLRLERWTGRKAYGDAARATLTAFAEMMRRAPVGFSQMLLALEADLREGREIVVLGKPAAASTQAVVQELWQRHLPNALVAVLDSERPDLEELVARVPLLAGKAEVSESARPLLFACRNHACEAPTTDLATALRELD
jgi:hypothetical protein